jgi:peptidoglycan hydrolase-like protein with peptidoglycan-binding domain
MLPPVVKKLPPLSQKRFEEAYTNKKRPIAWGEHDDIVVGLLQAWLYVLEVSSLPRSVVYELDEDTIKSDGIFGQETRDAVIAFQTTNKLKVDGFVGHDTLDKISEKLRRKFPPLPITRNSAVTVVKRPYRCPPGALICPEPPQ